MGILEICVPLIVAIFGVAYPLTISEIGNINTKYSSEKLSNRLRNEKEWKIFNIALYISLGSIAAYIFGKIFLFPIRINHLLIWTIFCSASALSVSFLFFVRKIFDYKSDVNLRNYLLRENQYSDTFDELADLFAYFIKKDPVSTDYELVRYFSLAFDSRRKAQINSKTGVIYFDVKYLSFITRFHNIVLKLNRHEAVHLQYNISGGEWLLGHERYGRISEDTWRVLWRNLSTAIENNRPDIAFRFWRNIYDYYDKMPVVLPENVDGQVINKTVVDFRQNERQDVIDFVTALGGLLFHTSNLKAINKIFYYTQSEPARYKILPDTIRDILILYGQYYSGEQLRYALIDLSFPFPDEEGVNSAGVIFTNIFSYIVLLYLRLSTIHSPFVNYEPMEYKGMNGNQVSAFLNFHGHFKNSLDFLTKNDALLRDVFGIREFRQDPIVYFEQIVNHYE
ncbi:hypothetical protein [Albibacterium bauzanense]|uniref:Uncharacterized protein n=1 Tax=Albibacterium bauzanense TaxID=653929 RepID=A0A4R1LQY8_9SPHI|nr:hypothetical protein [Albibacterium bauzanense]TCK80907.1 hypothetical protein C8N28_2662 [Albibacterium bauzanense]